MVTLLVATIGAGLITGTTVSAIETPDSGDIVSTITGNTLELDYDVSGVLKFDVDLSEVLTSDGSQKYANYDSNSSVYVTGYTVNKESVMTVDNQGKYTTLSEGVTNLTVEGYYYYWENSSWETETFSYSVTVAVFKDLSTLALSSTTLNVYSDKNSSSTVKGSVSLVGTHYTFSKSDITLTESASTSKISSWTIADNKITFVFKKTGSETITLSFYNRADNSYVKLKLKVKISKCYISSTSVLMYTGQKVTLKMKSTDSSSNTVDNSAITWTSSNTKVATINSSGKITAKKAGTAIITAVVNGKKYGSAVNVTSKKKYKAIKKAKSIYSSSSYSQAKRMSKGYYDCSSLVWRAYAPQGIYFGVKKGWAPVAASIAKYLSKHGKLKGKITISKIKKYALQAGDVIFKTGESNGRYKGIYHIEMFTGYRFTSFNSDGSANVTTTWVARYDGYLEYSIATESRTPIYGRP
ncbi:Ig-like domain (group 2) [Eubacterium oxidoreducens]|uniref:Ig-like domain (Group 2) n=2 Tax=Eubacterium oxidoreducens TaxID=1732 RepID=A0A1G6C0F7_EUBOX|nr:Ig-like domain (group 2) [Eubacterium oxidoreducens]